MHFAYSGHNLSFIYSRPLSNARLVAITLSLTNGFELCALTSKLAAIKSDISETLAFTDSTYLMFEGSILKHGEPEELAADEMVRKVYLGQNFELRKKRLEF